MDANNIEEHTPLLLKSDKNDEIYDDDRFRTSSILSTISRQKNDDDHPSIRSIHYSTTSRRSIYNSLLSLKNRSYLSTLDEKVSNDRRASLPFTVFNILLLLQGSGTFGIPFAVLHGGVWFIPAAFLLCLYSDLTGQLLIDCMYEVSPKSKLKKRVYGDLIEIAYACWGSRGKMLCNIVNIIYIFANNVVNVILLGKNAYSILHGHIDLNETQLAMAFAPLLFPLLFIKRFSILAYTSAIGVSAVILASLTSTIIFFKFNSSWHSNLHILSNSEINEFPLAIGILMYTLMVNSILAQIEGSMKNPEYCPRALHISFGISTILKLGFGVLGVLTFGSATSQIVSLDISKQSVPAKFILAICLMTYAITNFALMFIPFLELLDDSLYSMTKRKMSGILYTLWSILTRIFCLVLSVAIALYVPYFALVSGVIGSIIGILTIFVFPITFHLQLKWKRLSLLRKVSEMILLVIGIAVGMLATFSSTNALINAMRNRV